MKTLKTTCACTDCTCEKPSANLTINKGRIKKYDKNSETPIYYLKDGQEFELELFNSKSTKLLVKIKINGSLISQSGIVLNPGQRIFLDRYIDISKKFKFETYEVGNSKVVENAIKNNGDIEFLFYEETTFTDLSQGITWVNHGWGNGTGNPIYGNYYNSNIGGTTTLANTGEVTLDGLSDLTTSNFIDTSVPINNTSFSTTSLTSNVSDNSSRPIVRLKGIKKSKTKETGRVEMGGNSEQEFKKVNLNFNSYTTHEIRYKLLPVANKNLEVQDLKKYCTNCGASLKKNHRFCAQCGAKG